MQNINKLLTELNVLQQLKPLPKNPYRDFSLQEVENQINQDFSLVIDKLLQFIFQNPQIKSLYQNNKIDIECFGSSIFRYLFDEEIGFSDRDFAFIFKEEGAAKEILNEDFYQNTNFESVSIKPKFEQGKIWKDSAGFPSLGFDIKTSEGIDLDVSLKSYAAAKDVIKSKRDHLCIFDAFITNLVLDEVDKKYKLKLNLRTCFVELYTKIHHNLKKEDALQFAFDNFRRGGFFYNDYNQCSIRIDRFFMKRVLSFSQHQDILNDKFTINHVSGKFGGSNRCQNEASDKLDKRLDNLEKFLIQERKIPILLENLIKFIEKEDFSQYEISFLEMTDLRIINTQKNIIYLANNQDKLRSKLEGFGLIVSTKSASNNRDIIQFFDNVIFSNENNQLTDEILIKIVEFLRSHQNWPDEHSFSKIKDAVNKILEEKFFTEISNAEFQYKKNNPIIKAYFSQIKDSSGHASAIENIVKNEIYHKEILLPLLSDSRVNLKNINSEVLSEILVYSLIKKMTEVSNLLLIEGLNLDQKFNSEFLSRFNEVEKKQLFDSLRVPANKGSNSARSYLTKYVNLHFDGKTQFHNILESGDKNLISLYLANGANALLKMVNGLGAIDLLINRDDANDYLRFFFLVKTINQKDLKQLLQEYESRSGNCMLDRFNNAKKDREIIFKLIELNSSGVGNILFKFVSNGDLEMLKLLKDAKCDFNFKDTNGNSALHLAIMNLNKFVEDGASVSNALNIVEFLTDNSEFVENNQNQKPQDLFLDSYPDQIELVIEKRFGLFAGRVISPESSNLTSESQSLISDTDSASSPNSPVSPTSYDVENSSRKNINKFHKNLARFCELLRLEGVDQETKEVKGRLKAALSKIEILDSELINSAKDMDLWSGQFVEEAKFHKYCLLIDYLNEKDVDIEFRDLLLQKGFPSDGFENAVKAKKKCKLIKILLGRNHKKIIDFICESLSDGDISFEGMLLDYLSQMPKIVNNSISKNSAVVKYIKSPSANIHNKDFSKIRFLIVEKIIGEDFICRLLIDGDKSFEDVWLDYLTHMPPMANRASPAVIDCAKYLLNDIYGEKLSKIRALMTKKIFGEKFYSQILLDKLTEELEFSPKIETNYKTIKNILLLDCFLISTPQDNCAQLPRYILFHMISEKRISITKERKELLSIFIRYGNLNEEILQTPLMSGHFLLQESIVLDLEDELLKSLISKDAEMRGSLILLLSKNRFDVARAALQKDPNITIFSKISKYEEYIFRRLGRDSSDDPDLFNKFVDLVLFILEKGDFMDNDPVKIILDYDTKPEIIADEKRYSKANMIVKFVNTIYENNTIKPEMKLDVIVQSLHIFKNLFNNADNSDKIEIKSIVGDIFLSQFPEDLRDLVVGTLMSDRKPSGASKEQYPNKELKPRTNPNPFAANNVKTLSRIVSQSNA